MESRMTLVDSALTNSGTGAESFRIRLRAGTAKWELTFYDIDGGKSKIIADRRTLSALWNAIARVPND